MTATRSEDGKTGRPIKAAGRSDHVNTDPMDRKPD
jgi:hypothetical protein